MLIADVQQYINAIADADLLVLPGEHQPGSVLIISGTQPIA
jgi:hypothetical protein